MSATSHAASARGGASSGDGRAPPPPLAPNSTLACQVEATNAWRRDLRTLYSHSAERFPDVCWQADEDETKIWAHKAILYARAPNTFQARYLHLRSPAANLGELANSSQVSLPSLRAPSPGPSIQSDVSASASRRLKVRGVAPPSSFSPMARQLSANASDQSHHAALRNSTSQSSLNSTGLSISRPVSRGSVTSARSSFSMARESSAGDHSMRSSFSSSRDSDTMSISGSSIVSSASTVRAAPLPLGDVSPAFFESTLEFLYTAEESMVEAFEFFYEDRMAPAGRPEEGLEKLRQDFVFMWRSRLYSDVRIVLGEGDPDDAAPGTIPDADNASIMSTPVSVAPTVTDGGHGDEEHQEGPAVFSTHRMILVSRSPYFAAQLLGPYADAHATVLRLPSPPFTPASLHFALGFLYTGTLFFSNRSFDLATAFQLWRAGAYLQVDTLQTLVSSLIAADFCHGFACSPPCRTCLKRVPRALAFASAPDVGDENLRSQARTAVGGPHFGSYWFKDVGMLDYAARGALVADVCARVDRHPAEVLSVLGQLATVGARIDRERSSVWVDALRWMCESVEAHVRSVLEPNLEVIVASKEWQDLLDGVGSSFHILEKAMLLLLESLNERRAAHTYQTIVGQVLLRDEGPPPEGTARQLVEDARDGILRYLKKRWVGVRAQGGFNKLDNWALKELSHELDSPVADLTLPDTPAQPEAPLSRTGLRAAVPASQRPAVPAADEEREAGPVSMRAAVLNRAAARSSVANGFRSGTSAAPSQPASVMNRARGAPVPSSNVGSVASSMTSRGTAASSRASTASAASVRRATVSPAPRSAAPARTTTSTAARTGTTAALSRPAPAPRTVSAQSNASSRPSSSLSQRSSSASTAGTAGTDVRTSSSSVHSFRSRLNSNAASVTSPPRSPIRSPRSPPSPSVDQTRTPTAPRTLPLSSQATPRAARPSTNSLAPASTPSLRSVRSNTSIRFNSASTTATPRAPAPASAAAASRHTFLKATPRPANAAPVPRARLSSTASNASVASVGPKRAPSAPSLKTSAASVQRPAVSKPAPAKPKLAQSATAAAARSPASSTASVAKTRSPHAPAAELAQPAAPASEDTSLAMDVDEQPLSVGSDLMPGISLAHGIPCIVSPRRSTRFRAVVKYIGPLPGEVGAWVGVEVSLPLPKGVEGLSFNDGSFAGMRLFDLTSKAAAEEVSLAPTPEREARRRRIARIVARGASPHDRDAAAEDLDAPLPSAGEEGGAPNAKRRKDLSGLSASLVDKENVDSRGLFLRPTDVLWVVT